MTNRRTTDKYLRWQREEELRALVDTHAADPHSRYIAYVTRGCFERESVTEYVYTGAHNSGSRKRKTWHTWEKFDETAEDLGETYDQFAERCRLAALRQTHIRTLRQELGR
jgi:hypothetical protein